MYEFLEETVERNMTSPAKAVAPEMTTGDLLRLFASDDLDAYPVVSNGKLVGIVSKADALKAFVLTPGSIIPHYDDMMGTTVDEIMTRQVMTVERETRLQHVLHLMGAHHFKSLPVVDQEQPPEGHDRARGCHPGACLAMQPAPGSAAGRAGCRLLRNRLTAIRTARWRRPAVYRPAANAMRINSDMLRAPVLAMRLARYTSTVRGLMLRSCAITLLIFPATSPCRTSRSRGDSSASRASASCFAALSP